MQVHQQVVHQIFDVALVMPAKHHAQGHPVYRPQWMVGDERVFVRQVGDMLQTLHFHLHVQILQAVLTKVNAHITFFQESINEILVNQPLEPVNQEAGDVFGLLPGTVAHDFVQINQRRATLQFSFLQNLFTHDTKCSRNNDLGIVYNIRPLGQTAYPIGSLTQPEQAIKNAIAFIHRQHLRMLAGNQQRIAPHLDFHRISRRHTAVLINMGIFGKRYFACHGITTYRHWQMARRRNGDSTPRHQRHPQTNLFPTLLQH